MIQYIKMTKDIDFNTMTTDKETEEFRDDLYLPVKDQFISALGEAAITEVIAIHIPVKWISVTQRNLCNP